MYDSASVCCLCSTAPAVCSGQAGALKHGISRAIVKLDETKKAIIKKAGFLTRDPRAKERKKYGRKRARKKFQYSKR